MVEPLGLDHRRFATSAVAEIALPNHTQFVEQKLKLFYGPEPESHPSAISSITT